MKALITGCHGTLGQALSLRLQQRGHTVVAWDRHAADPLQPHRHAEWVAGVRPDVIFHLAIAAQPTGADNEAWRVNVEWSETLARIAHEQKITLVFTSTALVFNNEVSGPFTPDSPPNATEGYGHDKRRAEERVRAACPDARIVRLGWQIGLHTHGNSMGAWAEQQQRDHGCVGVSTRWYPACSFLPDTADALVRVTQLPPGLYLADSNRGWTFDAIVRALQTATGRPWDISPNEDYVYDQRLRDVRLPLPALSMRLPLPPLPA